MISNEESIRSIEEAIKNLKSKNKSEHFTSVAPDEIETMLLRNSPWFYGLGWSDSTPGGILSCFFGIHNPPPNSVSSLYVHVCVSSSFDDSSVDGPVRWNVDTRFPRLMQPGFSGFVMNPDGKKD